MKPQFCYGLYSSCFEKHSFNDLRANFYKSEAGAHNQNFCFSLFLHMSFYSMRQEKIQK